MRRIVTVFMRELGRPTEKNDTKHKISIGFPEAESWIFHAARHGFLRLPTVTGKSTEVLMASYSEKLKDPRWQKKRLKVLERDEFRCKMCGGDKETLHVHHLKYGGDPWDIELGLLTTLCETCHTFSEQIIEKARLQSGCDVKMGIVDLAIKISNRGQHFELFRILKFLEWNEADTPRVAHFMDCYHEGWEHLSEKELT